MRILSPLAGSIVAMSLAGAAGSGHAEVWEYGEHGEIVSFGRQAAAPEVETNAPVIGSRDLPMDAAHYRAMAEIIALQYAGTDGVRLAGLDALSFMQVFCALIEQESRFNPRAVSPKGAQGLGQLMPQTAALLEVEDPFDPEASLHGAARYFTDQLALFQNVELALAAYNAGPHRIVQYDGIPPFRETRNYVAKITKAAGLTPTGVGPASAREPRAFTPPPPPPSEKKASVWEF